MLDGIARQPGTYLLIFSAAEAAAIRVGRLAVLDLQPGYYIYIGSAFGPGGVRARVKHHAGISKKPHWHLDYIRPKLALEEIWYSIDTARYEHEWAEIMYYTLKMQVPVQGLGASDCRCESHFFHTHNKPERATLNRALKKNNKDLKITILDKL